ncbi:hypothetical protein ACDY99_24065 [Achromobacter dolens]|uniref:hypothetical protein n=1 Tax=Achromobacter dolens TaxID=1287738 RepID=UPI003556606B
MLERVWKETEVDREGFVDLCRGIKAKSIETGTVFFALFLIVALPLIIIFAIKGTFESLRILLLGH